MMLQFSICFSLYKVHCCKEALQHTEEQMHYYYASFMYGQTISGQINLVNFM